MTEEKFAAFEDLEGVEFFKCPYCERMHSYGPTTDYSYEYQCYNPRCRKLVKVDPDVIRTMEEARG